MQNIIPNLSQLQTKYADAVVAKFKKARYGIATCGPIKDLVRIRTRLQLSDWQNKTQ